MTPKRFLARSNLNFFDGRKSVPFLSPGAQLFSNWRIALWHLVPGFFQGWYSHRRAFRSTWGTVVIRCCHRRGVWALWALPRLRLGLLTLCGSVPVHECGSAPRARNSPSELHFPMPPCLWAVGPLEPFQFPRAIGPLTQKRSQLCGRPQEMGQRFPLLQKMFLLFGQVSSGLWVSGLCPRP